ncbi:MAG: DUF6537 domain-containing protein, partial [Acetobacteraceae bacterium]
EYMGDVRTALAAPRPETADIALALAELPDMIRGFGQVKEANRVKAMERREMLLARLRAPERVAAAAE